MGRQLHKAGFCVIAATISCHIDLFLLAKLGSWLVSWIPESPVVRRHVCVLLFLDFAIVTWLPVYDSSCYVS